MTCIVGLIEKNTVWIGGDTYCSNNAVGHELAYSKVFVKGDFLFGCSGTPRHQLVLMSSEFKPDAQKPEQSDLEYMSITVVDHIKQLFIKHGCVRIIDGQTYEQDSFMLIGYKGHLYELESNFQVCSYNMPYAATGSGYQVALGALHAMKDQRMKPNYRIEKALQAASDHTIYVRPPFNILSIKHKEVKP